MDLEQRLLDFSLLGAAWVMWLLVLLSVICIAVAVERAAYFRLNRTDDAVLESAIGAFLKSGDREAFQKQLDELKVRLYRF